MSSLPGARWYYPNAGGRGFYRFRLDDLSSRRLDEGITAGPPDGGDAGGRRDGGSVLSWSSRRPSGASWGAMRAGLGVLFAYQACRCFARVPVAAEPRLALHPPLRRAA